MNVLDSILDIRTRVREQFRHMELKSLLKPSTSFHVVGKRIDAKAGTFTGRVIRFGLAEITLLTPNQEEVKVPFKHMFQVEIVQPLQEIAFGK